jgi:tetratricopeptide (TPR) repeat protein
MRHALGVRDELAHHLRERELLLVLDTFEHLVDAASDLADLLASASGLRLIVTSRVPLHLSAEYEYPVDPLPDGDATTLFVERARAVGHHVELDETVSEICARLDNLPLALELAAARMKLLDPVSLLARLEHRLPLLGGGPRDAPERQHTLRAAIEWSYDLLDDGANRSSHGSRFSPAASRSRLPRKSGRRTSTCCGDSWTRASSDPSATVACSCSKQSASTASSGSRRRARVRRHVTDTPSTSHALRMAAGSNSFAATAPTGASPRFGWSSGTCTWRSSGRSNEDGRRTSWQSARASTLGGDPSAATRAYEESLAIFRDLDEPFGIAANLTQLADLALLQGERETARRFAEESAATRRERLGSLYLGRALASLANISVAEADYDQARELLEEAIQLWSVQIPESQQMIACHESLGEVLRLQEDFGNALEAFATSLRIGQRRGEPPLPDALEGMAAVWATLGERERVARTVGAAQRIREQRGTAFPEHPDRPLPEPVEPAWSEGRAMSAEEAVEYALSSLTDA